MKTQALLLSLLFAATAQAKPTTAGTAPATTPAAATTTATAPAANPTDTCNKLVEAAKADNYDAAAAISTWGEGKGQGPKSKGKFAKMHNDYLGKIKGITCGTAYVADETAVVEAQAEGKKRFVPFVNEAGTWKFNVQAYKALYNVPKGAQGKKAM
jgi:hypothetical protein